MCDISTGYRAYSKSALKKITLESKGFAIHSEIPIKFFLKNFRIKEIPISYKKRGSGFSKLRYTKEGKDYIKILLNAFKKRLLRI